MLGNDSPFISIIIRTYNRPELLKRSLTSLLNQTYQNIQIVVINDGSVIDYGPIVNSFKDERITFLNHKKNQGVRAAFNTGLDNARGQLIAGLDDDDALFPNAVEVVFNKYLENDKNNIKMFWFNVVDVDSGTMGGGGLVEEGYIEYDSLLCRQITGDHWIVFDGDMLRQVRFDTTIKAHEGMLWLELLKKNKAYYYPIDLYQAYRDHGPRVSTEKVRGKLKEIILAKKEYLRIFGDDLANCCPKRHSELISEIGYFYLLNNEADEGRKFLWQSLKNKIITKYALLYLSSYVLPHKLLMFCLKSIKKI